ncbi:MAG: SCO family protein [Dokdonella sp.]
MKFPPMHGRVSATWLILIAAFAVALGLWFGARLLGPAAPPRLETAVLYPAARLLPDFQLTRSDGQPLTLADWKGHWTVAFFGYTNCPDVCPTTLTSFKQAWKLLGADAATPLRFDFISVDPARDTPETLARYVGYFSKDFIAASGSDEQLTALTKALGLLYARGTPENGTYTVDHSASAVIIDPQGRQVGMFRPPFDAAKIAADLTTLLSLPATAPRPDSGRSGG